MNYRHIVLTLLTALPLTILAGDQPGNAITIVATELRKDPAAQATVLANLPAQTTVVVGDRQGGWYKTEVNGKSGWIRLLSVRMNSSNKVAGSSGLAALGQASGRSSSTLTTGIRGLTAENIKNAKENPAEVAKMERYAVSVTEAQKYARDGGVIANEAN